MKAVRLRRAPTLHIDPATYLIHLRIGTQYRHSRIYRVQLWIPRHDGKPGRLVHVGDFSDRHEAQRRRDAALLEWIEDARSIYPWLRWR